MDKDGSGSLTIEELRAALQALKFRLNTHIFTATAIRFGDEEGKVSFDEFVKCVARLRKCASELHMAGKRLDTECFTSNEI